MIDQREQQYAERLPDILDRYLQKPLFPEDFDFIRGSGFLLVAVQDLEGLKRALPMRDDEDYTRSQFYQQVPRVLRAHIPAFYTWITSGANIATFAKALGWTEHEARALLDRCAEVSKGPTQSRHPHPERGLAILNQIQSSLRATVPSQGIEK